MKRVTTVASLLALLLVVALAPHRSQAQYGDSAMQWQFEDDERHRLRERENELLDKERNLKREIWELDRNITIEFKQKKYDEQDLDNVESQLIALKMQML
jgi:C4-dicarboxylate-specific signal transduction histidine kinase